MIKHNEIVDIEAFKPFDKCQLDRKKYADVLTNIVSTYADGFVLAINNKWGTGKTTFIRMWEQDLRDQEFKTVLFNAWENDFENNALTALMGELKTLTKKDEVNPNFESALKNAAVFTKNLAPVLVKAIVKKYMGASYEDLAEGVANSIGDIFEKDVNEYADKKKSIKDFRKSLSKFIADTWDGKPVVFIIDELDRCRPDYAVSILEQIKHFFSIPNIVFVLSIDKEQLGHAVRGVYGSESIDANEYLRRFIDIEYSIPEPDVEKYVKYLYNYYGFDEFFKKPSRVSLHNQSYEIKNEIEDFIKLSTILFKHNNLTLRQIDKIFSKARLSLKTFKTNYYVMPELFVFLIFMKSNDYTLYNELLFRSIKIEELIENFSAFFKLPNTENENNIIVKLEANLFYFYYLYFNQNNYERKFLFTVDEVTNNYTSTFKSTFDTKHNQQRFLQIISNLSNNHHDLSYLLNNIELLENIKD
jgi:hypothetical protein